jgi:hypothetical protein
LDDRAGHIGIAGRIHGDAGDGSIRVQVRDKVCGVTQYRIDDERPAVVISADLEADLADGTITPAFEEFCCIKEACAVAPRVS